jgi:hypothetical protein
MQDFSGLWPGKTVVIGGGRFGRIALERLRGKIALVVEPRPTPGLERFHIPIWRQGGIEASLEMLASQTPPQYLVPTLPLHLFGEWLRLSTPRMQPKSLNITKDILKNIQSNTQCIDNMLYLSLADFICPDDCPEPANTCTVTGQARGLPLYQRIAALSSLGYKTAVIRSRQLAPGVGGLLVQDLLEMRQRIIDSPGDWIVATACRCHGVLQLLNFNAPQAE